MVEGHVQALLNRLSFAAAVIATVSLLYIISHSSLSCQPLGLHHLHHEALTLTLARTPFPRSSCDSAARRHPIPPEKRAQRLRSTRDWRRRVDSFAILFRSLRALGLLANASRVLCVAAGAGHEVAALRESGVDDVTGVDVVDVPPLVSRSDLHNLPFFDGVFDLGFSAGLDRALFPSRFVAEMERTVLAGGAVVLAVERCSSEEDVEEVRNLFRKSSLIGVRNVSLVGLEMTAVIMRNNNGIHVSP